MFLDLEFYKRKVANTDSVLMIQDTIIICQSNEIKQKERDLEASQTSEKQALFKADFMGKFADKQQGIVIKVLQRQNRTFLIGGAIIGVLVTLIITK